MIHSALFRGRVVHRRTSPKEHSFDYGVQLLYLDLEELPDLFRGRWLWSVERANLIRFKRSDYLGDAQQPLRDAVLDRVEAKLGRRPEGRLGLLTQVRTLGYLFNPVSFYFCWNALGELDAIVAEITNTPWGERHAYVLDAKVGHEGNGEYAFHFDKCFHISPFFPMEQAYSWRFVWTEHHLQVHMTNREAGRPVFRVSLACERQAINRRCLAASFLAFPLQPLRLHIAIYWQAARLFFKRVPVFTHPKKSQPLRGAQLP